MLSAGEAPHHFHCRAHEQIVLEMIVQTMVSCWYLDTIFKLMHVLAGSSHCCFHNLCWFHKTGPFFQQYLQGSIHCLSLLSSIQLVKKINRKFTPFGKECPELTPFWQRLRAMRQWNSMPFWQGVS